MCLSQLESKPSGFPSSAAAFEKQWWWTNITCFPRHHSPHHRMTCVQRRQCAWPSTLPPHIARQRALQRNSVYKKKAYSQMSYSTCHCEPTFMFLKHSFACNHFLQLTTVFAIFRVVKTLPGSEFVISDAGARESEQPIHNSSGACPLALDRRVSLQAFVSSQSLFPSK